MSTADRSPQTGNNSSKKTPRTRKGKTPKQVMTRHIKDKNDVITEEEFKELEIGPESLDTAHEPLDLPEKEERPKDEDKDHDTITPWDVIK